MNTVSAEHLQFGSNIVRELVKLCTHNIAKEVNLVQTESNPMYPISEAGKGKVLYIGGMCVAKQSNHHKTIIFSNLNNSDKTVIKHENISTIKLSLLQKMVADKDVDLNDKIVQEIERKQHVRQVLTYSTEQYFQFCIILNTKINSPLKTQIFQEKKMSLILPIKVLKRIKTYELYFKNWL